jgi:transcriptional regulator NrdR family protein
MQKRDAMLEFLGLLLSSLFDGWDPFDVEPTDRQRIRHALRISRKKRPLTPEQYDFATRWLQYGLDHLKELKLESKEVGRGVGLMRVKRAQVAIS